MRLIDADALKEKLQEQQKYGSTSDSRGRAKAIVEVIHAPTIEANPMKRGRWKRLSQFCLECSCCADISDCLTNYCSECGAKMEGIDET